MFLEFDTVTLTFFHLSAVVSTSDYLSKQHQPQPVYVAMAFSDLPPELVLHTASTLDSARDIYSLMSVNRVLYQLLKKYLYQRNVDHENSTGLVRVVGMGSLCATCCFLSLPRVKVHVRNDAG